MNDMDVKEQLSHVLSVKRKYERWFLEKSHVVGVGVGLRRLEESQTSQVVIIVNVSQKVPCEQLSPEEEIPEEVEGVPVEVETIGELRAQEEDDDDCWPVDYPEDDEDRPLGHFSAH
jgi:hypothetical protein